MIKLSEIAENIKQNHAWLKHELWEMWHKMKDDEILERICRLEKLIKEQPKVGEWIQVSERLPEDGRSVVVTLAHTYESDYTKHSIARYIDCSNGEYHWCDEHHGYLEWDKYSDGSGGCSHYKVIAWMPLPEPYKEEGGLNDRDNKAV